MSQFQILALVAGVLFVLYELHARGMITLGGSRPAPSPDDLPDGGEDTLQFDDLESLKASYVSATAAYAESTEALKSARSRYEQALDEADKHIDAAKAELKGPSRPKDTEVKTDDPPA